MKKIRCLLFICIQLFLTSFLAPAFEAENIKELSLANGLKIYVLEDMSSPVIRTEISIAAGYRMQNEKNAGFFTLYANLLGLEISGDRVRASKTVSPLEFEKLMSDFSRYLRPLNVTDSRLKAAYEASRKDVAETSSSAAGFINSAIETRMFPQSPWKNESSISPKSFSSKSIFEVRSILNEITENFYIPSRTSIFISGNITVSSALTIARQYFDDFPQKNNLSYESQSEKKLSAALNEGKIGKEKKFVLYDKSFSDEMTQIVVEYKDFSGEESDELSSVWNENHSKFKALLLKQKNLKILGGDYIDVSSSPEKDSPRLIIQSLLGSAKVSPVVQAGLFLEMSRDETVISEDELEFSARKTFLDFQQTKENSTLLMEGLSKFISRNGDLHACEAFFEENTSGKKLSAESLSKKLSETEPYVFVLVNSSVYAKYSKEFKNAGYSPVNFKNGAWYNQKYYADLIKQKSQDSQEQSKSAAASRTDIADSARRFIEKHRADFSGFTLKNEIPVCVKTDSSSKNALISFSIAGGDLLFAKKTPGLTAVLTDSIAVNMQRAMDLFATQGVINGYYDVTSKTFATHSVITISCDARDLIWAIQSAYSALVFSDITPATADGVTYDERTQWRLKSGSGDFQLLCETIRILYKDSELPLLYQDAKDKPLEMNFTKILEGYPYLLDASRFSIVVTGGISDLQSLKDNLEKTFGELSSQNATRIYSLAIPHPEFKKQSKKVSIRHLFLTDISKDKAGPMPAKLIPTTKFLDPVLYCLPSPDLSSTDAALFDALLIELASRIEEKISKINPQSAVKLSLATADLPFVRLAVTNVERTSEADKIYRESVQSLKNDLKQLIASKTEGVIDAEKNPLLSKIESGWILKVLSQASTPHGTAQLIESGLILKNAQLYLDQYDVVDKAEAEDYFLIAESMIEAKAPLILYSKDSR